MHTFTKTFSTKRLVTTALGIIAVLASLLAGALTSVAAADDALPFRSRTAAPMVTTGTPVVERVATSDMLVAEVDAQPFVGKGAKAITARPGHQFASACTVEFEDSDALLIQPDHARSQFVSDPWRERCGDIWTEVTATKYLHLHLDYAAGDIGPCFVDSSPLNGTYARLSTGPGGEQVCTDFDPLTEPRISPRTHHGSEVVRFKMYDIDGYQPFRLDRIRVVDQPIRLCAQPVDATPTLVFGEAGDGGMASASCWNLTAGLWDLSAHTDNTGTVTMTGVDGNSLSFGFDDMMITDQS